jgi:hypothetical protein
VPNHVISPVSASGDIAIYNQFGYVDVLFDVVGYFTIPSTIPA